MMKAMDSARGHGAKRSDTPGCREDLHRRHRAEDTVSYFDISAVRY
jgi:hypothetical protein